METQQTIRVARDRAKDAGASAHVQLPALLESLPSGVVFADASGRVKYANHLVIATLGIDSKALVGEAVLVAVRRLADRFANPEDLERTLQRSMRDRTSGSHFEVRLRNGRIYEGYHAPVLSPRSFRGHLWQFIDVTSRRSLEAQLQHSERMESIGRLAGGVAHDFNNLLTAVLGYIDLAATTMAPGTEAREHLSLATEAAEQATALTRQLLVFARRETALAVTLDLNKLVERMTSMLRRLVPENIELEVRLCTRACWIRAEAGQLDQVLVNLVLNARDAMPEGGKLSLGIACTTGVPGVEQVTILEVSDTGVGMDEETRLRVFEPFFTTKERGRGTGLGLAMVYGVVQQYGGRIEVQSEQGRGTRFQLALPLASPPADAPLPPPRELIPRGSEVVLAVEDDPLVRGLVGAMLENLGYRPLLASNADEAVRIARSLPGDLDLLLTDVVMPGMSGKELAARLRDSRPGLRVLLMSGYAPALPSRRVADQHFLPKPFTIDVLGARLREVLALPA